MVCISHSNLLQVMIVLWCEFLIFWYEFWFSDVGFFLGSELLTIMFSRKNDFRSFMNCLRRHIIFSDNRKINFELVKDFFWKHAVSSLLILFLQKLFLNTERIKLCKFVVSLPTLNKNNFEKFLMLDFFILNIFFLF